MGDVNNSYTVPVTFEFWVLALLVTVEAVWLVFLGSLVVGYEMSFAEVTLLALVGYIGCRREQFFAMVTDIFRKKQKGTGN
ncbi:hypothetical protein [Bacillus thuringiensis]|uniref:hypothetical protein n=1 Tax=Bacillus thuringiensis TaxID=1428 RepID=UPI000BFDAB5F|nr:hypothetical protein [Bacillus thuringiensis]PGT89909.1 hypothetical protein COD17_09160 [Bacillus thuringiensis]